MCVYINKFRTIVEKSEGVKQTTEPKNEACSAVRVDMRVSKH